MTMVFLNAITGQTEAEARRPPNMTPEDFDRMESACREGDGYSVADLMLAVMDHDPHPDYFLVPST